MPTLLKHTVFNELSNARNTNNMAILQVMFNIDKEVAPTSLALVSIISVSAILKRKIRQINFLQMTLAMARGESSIKLS